MLQPSEHTGVPIERQRKILAHIAAHPLARMRSAAHPA